MDTEAVITLEKTTDLKDWRNSFGQVLSLYVHKYDGDFKPETKTFNRRRNKRVGGDEILMNVKRISIVAGKTVLIIFLIIFHLLIRLLVGFGLALLPRTQPEITYGEFPVRLTYELNGEIRTVQDVAICEFDGYKVSIEDESRKWKVTLKSELDEPPSDKEQWEETDFVLITLLDLRNKGIYDDFGHEVLELYFFGGNGSYYMNDVMEFGHDAQDFTCVEYMYKTEDGKIGGSSFGAEEAYEKFNIRLISWEAAKPIRNTFVDYFDDPTAAFRDFFGCRQR